MPEDKTKKEDKKIEIEDILLKNRKVFLYNEVTSTNSEKLIKQLFVLENFNKKPILLYINSPGGSTSDGFSLINIMIHLKSPVYTIINGEACSMGGLISIVGKKRFMTQNSFWMGHDMRGGIWGDYSGKVEYRAEYIKKLWTMLENHLKNYTKLTQEDLTLLRNGELWLSAEECLKKGIIDTIL
jgi:ATP-dependent Clp protease protease subunit